MTTAASLASYASNFPNFRNRIINGDMRIDQRNAGVISNPTGGTNTYTIDRWQFSFYNPGSRVTNVQQVSDDVPKGFSHSMKVSCGNNSGTQDANEQLLIQQQIEGHNVGDFSWYDNSPSVLTLSFYVKSNLTGSFPLIIKLSSNNSSQNSVGTRTLPLKYEINTANTWERKSVTFTLDEYSGTRIISNTFAIAVAFYLSAGSSRRGVAYNVWRGNANQATSGLDNYTFLDSTSNEFFITGVQLEVGTVPTPFEHRPYGTELALCQRYFERINGTDTSIGTGSNYNNSDFSLSVKLSVEKRTDSIAVSTSADGGTLFTAYGTNASGSTYPWETSSPTINKRGNRHSVAYSHNITGSSAGGAGTAVMAYLRTNQYINISAEL